MSLPIMPIMTTLTCVWTEDNVEVMCRLCSELFSCKLDEGQILTGTKAAHIKFVHASLDSH